MFKQKKLSSGVRFGIAAASFFLGVLLFLTAISTALIANIQIVTSEDSISGMVREFLGAPAHVRPVSAPLTNAGGLRIASRTRTYQMPRRENPDDVAADLTEQLIGMFYEALKTQFGEEISFTQEEFTQMINNSTAKDYVATKTAALITDYFNDEITTTFEAEEIVQLIHENSEMIESITGQPIPDDISQQVAKMFDENEIIIKVEKEGLAGFMSMLEKDGSASTDSGFDLRSIVNTVRDVSATQNLILGIVICLALIAAIILINCHQLPRGLRRAGYPLMMAGTLVILNLLAQVAPGIWVVQSEPNLTFVLKLVRYFLLKTAVVNIVVFCTGFALCISGIVLGIVLKAKDNPVVSVPATPEAEELAAAVLADASEETCDAPAEETTEEVCEEETVAEESAAEEATPIGE